MESMVQAPGANRAQEYLAAAEQAVRAYCGWHVAPVVDEALTLDGSGTNTLFIPTLRVVAISAITNGDQVLDPATLEWSADGFARLPYGQLWTDKLRGVNIQLRHGYQAAPDLVEIIRAMAARAQSAPDTILRSQVGMVSQTVSMVAPNVAGGVVLMDHERAMLEPYRIRAAG